MIKIKMFGKSKLYRGFKVNIKIPLRNNNYFQLMKCDIYYK